MDANRAISNPRSRSAAPNPSGTAPARADHHSRAVGGVDRKGQQFGLRRLLDRDWFATTRSAAG